MTGLTTGIEVQTRPTSQDYQKTFERLPEQRKGQRLITLTTCSELFHTDDRMISFGHLVKTEPKTGL